MSRSARNRLVRLGDVVATVLFVAHFAHPHRTRELRYIVVTSEYSPPATPGAMLRELATRQEHFYGLYGHYAPRASELTELTLPPSWRAAVIAASADRYRMRLDAPAEGGGGVICQLWGRRLRRETIEPFDIDCRPFGEHLAFVAVLGRSR